MSGYLFRIINSFLRTERDPVRSPLFCRLTNVRAIFPYTVYCFTALGNRDAPYVGDVHKALVLFDELEYPVNKSIYPYVTTFIYVVQVTFPFGPPVLEWPRALLCRRPLRSARFTVVFWVACTARHGRIADKGA